MAEEETSRDSRSHRRTQAEPADIPDWLQDVADEDVTPEPVAEVDESAAGPDMSDWLQEMAEEETPEPVAQTEEDETADLLSGMAVAGIGWHRCSRRRQVR